jgi:hypothetical protein
VVWTSWVLTLGGNAFTVLCLPDELKTKFCFFAHSGFMCFASGGHNKEVIYSTEVFGWVV